jgi:hypothetical protein
MTKVVVTVKKKLWARGRLARCRIVFAELPGAGNGAARASKQMFEIYRMQMPKI